MGGAGQAVIDPDGYEFSLVVAELTEQAFTVFVDPFALATYA